MTYSCPENLVVLDRNDIYQQSRMIEPTLSTSRSLQRLSLLNNTPPGTPSRPRVHVPATRSNKQLYRVPSSSFLPSVNKRSKVPNEKGVNDSKPLISSKSDDNLIRKKTSNRERLSQRHKSSSDMHHHQRKNRGMKEKRGTKKVQDLLKQLKEAHDRERQLQRELDKVSASAGLLKTAAATPREQALEQALHEMGSSLSAIPALQKERDSLLTQLETLQNANGDRSSIAEGVQQELDKTRALLEAEASARKKLEKKCQLLEAKLAATKQSASAGKLIQRVNNDFVSLKIIVLEENPQLTQHCMENLEQSLNALMEAFQLNA